MKKSKKSNKKIATNQRFRLMSAGLAIVAVLIVGAAGVNYQNSSQAARAKPTATVQTLLIKPASTTITPGSNVSAAIYANSGTVPVNVAQIALVYPAGQLEFMSIGESTAFPVVASTDTSTPGLIRIARSIATGSAAGVTGEQLVATVNFKVLPGASGTASLSYDLNSTLLVSAADGQNVISTTAGATYRIRNR
ncbi:MAG TPA: cohesin domain-containing protein [Candidatus Saccharimonadales bacterium]|jgi:hypothetical protein